MKEQEVIKRLNFHKEYVRLSSNRVVISETDLETVLNILKQNSAELAEKSAEIEKKDKIIDLMAEYMFNKNKAQLIIEYGIENKEQFIEKFEKLAKEKGE